MTKYLTVIFILVTPFVVLAQPAVRVESPDPQRTQPLQKQTETAAIRDYLQSWQNLRSALGQNRPDLLDGSFVGIALDKLTDTMHQQSALGIHTGYQDLAHDLQVVSYSPEGLSIQLVDKVEYVQQVLDHGKILATQRVRARYVIVMSPAEVRWKVRVFQAEPE